MLMSTDIIGNFSPLDELVQLVYQGIYQFVVLSSVAHDRWMMHVGMVGDAGRWWRGVWTEKDVVNTVGPKPSDQLLETFVDKLVDAIVDGEIYLADFSPEKGAKNQLIFGPTNISPVVMPLEEMDPAGAAAHATNVFLEIALQAQSRRCRLHPSSFTPTTTYTTARPVVRDAGTIAGGRGESSGAEKVVPAAVGSSPGRPAARAGGREDDMRTKEDVEDGIQVLKREDGDQKRVVHQTSEKLQPIVKAKGPARRTKGASLANPNKKARKFQAIEFASDDD